MVQTAACPTCSGRGEMISSPCTTCRSTGLERKNIKKKVQIPAGVDVGTQIRLTGEGGPGVFGGPNGSLFLVINVKPHQFFKRRDNDILLNLDINVAQAALGAEVHVPTIDGDEKLKIPAGTQPGKIFHIKGKGVPHVRSKHQRGDEIVMVNVAIPAKLTKEQRELFEKLAESLGTSVKPQEKGFLDWLNDAFGG
jgi:molecular chaperone DnaJ